MVFLLVTVTLAARTRVFAVSMRPGTGTAVSVIGAGFAAGVPDPDHHRRAALGDRHRRHGPHDAGAT
jgi:hypothetical protein